MASEPGFSGSSARSRWVWWGVIIALFALAVLILGMVFIPHGHLALHLDPGER
jgi:hypothetical protein